MEVLIGGSPEWGQEILRRRQAGDGSSSTVRGARASRSWSATASSSSVCRRLRHAKSGSTSGSDRSTAGPGGIRTSGSSRSSNVEDGIIGTAGPIPVEEGA